MTTFRRHKIDKVVYYDVDLPNEIVSIIEFLLNACGAYILDDQIDTIRKIDGDYMQQVVICPCGADGIGQVQISFEDSDIVVQLSNHPGEQIQFSLYEPNSLVRIVKLINIFFDSSVAKHKLLTLGFSHLNNAFNNTV